MTSLNFHEPFRDDDAPPKASPRSFGFLMTFVLGIVALWISIVGNEPFWWLIAPAVVLAGISVFSPQILTLPFRAWMMLGHMMHIVMSPLIMGLLFYGVVTPFGLGRRLFRRDPLGVALRPSQDTYFVDHDPGSRDMKKQF